MTLLDATQKKSLPAIDVFAAAIKFLKNHLLSSLGKNSNRFPMEELDTEWVLTVPAIWNDEARQFMREAAKKAGIQENHLSLALEPEAASVLCLVEDNEENRLDISKIGQKYMIVDCGGGTVDITVYEVKEDGVLMEIHHPVGGNCAGTSVDDAFKEFLYKISHFDVIAAIEKLEMLELMREFEKTKRNFASSPEVAVKLFKTGVEAFTCVLEERNCYAGKVRIVRDSRLLIEKTIFEGFFDKAIKSVIKLVTDVLSHSNLEGLDTILLVGGFADCQPLQTAVKEKFSARFKVIIPDNPAAAVLKGAVLYRHNPAVIGWRASAFTYGIEVDESFIEGRHDEEKAHFIEGKKHCKELFASFIKINDIVPVNETAKKEIFTTCEFMQTELVLPIYKSLSTNPLYITDESCKKLGQVTIKLKERKNPDDREVEVEMVVGGTELVVCARDRATGEEYAVVCDFLSK